MKLLPSIKVRYVIFLVDSHTEKLVVCSRKGYHTLKLAVIIFVVDYKSVNYKSFLPQNFMVYMSYFQMKKTILQANSVGGRVREVTSIILTTVQLRCNFSSRVSNLLALSSNLLKLV